ncbi:MAG TPA: coproporphyrinogen-III oxidase family protein [Acidobacteriota bacterium]|nr:coproporphyrinogen-III oxidase family protein [Acidobacteriota bacterium]
MNSEALLSEISARRKNVPEKSLQIYLHIPFCTSKCHFCDWVDDIPVTQLRSGVSKRRQYVDSLRRQIEHWGPYLGEVGYKTTCIYWGGGTPTRLEAESFPLIQQSLESAFDLSSLSQHTLETTPSDLTPEKLEKLEEIGVDRLSIGVQSFDPDQLRRAGRAHSAEQAVEAIRLAKRSSIEDVNIDLISGFPEETLADFKRTLEIAVELEPTHVSVYSYRATPRTVMAVQTTRGVRHGLELDSMIESYELAQDVLTQAGYREYCFNYFAKEKKYEFEAGMYGYKLQGDIVGFGAGAESTLGTFSLLNEDTELDEYVEDPLGFDTVKPFSLERPEMFFPLFGAALMTEDGINFKRFQYLTGLPFSEAWQSPDIKAWFQYVENCGAKLSFEDDGIRSADRNIHRVYLKNLVYTLNPALVELT